MKDAVRVILVDPCARTRQDLQRQLGGLADVEVVEVCTAYAGAAKRVAAALPTMALIVVDDDLEAAVGQVVAVAQAAPEVAVVTAGSDRDGGLILQTVRAGAREFLPLPVSPPELIDLIRRIRPRTEPAPGDGPRGPRMIAVAGAAGGVGCTSLAVNLAAALSKLSRRDTVLADFDLLLGSLEESLDVNPDHSLEVLVRDLDGMNPDALKRWMGRHACGLYVLPHPVSMEESASIDPEAIRAVLELLKESFDTTVVDTSKGLQNSDFLAFEAADVILVVLQLNLNCTRNTVRLLQYLRHFEGLGEKIRLVVNRGNSPLSEISVRKAEELLKTTMTWQVPNATNLFRPARTMGVPIDEVDGGDGSKAHQAVLEIATALQPYPGEPVKARRRLFAFR